MIFDPLYIAIVVIGMALSGLASMWVRAAFSRWSKVPMSRGMTGRDVAAAILRVEGISGVTIEETTGRLSDHYDPTSRTLRLSSENYRGMSIASAGIAAHEVGHAIQHKVGYWPMTIRQRMVPIASLGTNFGMALVMIGALFGAMGLAKLGVLIFAGFVAFTLVTLPVEIDASLRARKALVSGGILSNQESVGVSKMLTAAAATYLAAAVVAILNLLYLALRAGLLGRGDD